ncbi:ubiquinone biosynthesis accessory factor UbiJ [Sodalis-like endosymbiont of Proechinophthirus fluctus]|uniref:ubiquinone biosynthesis accessory factor UbiJ n=1 Tax=Sodalis-like endosymbiont of Proechinophthirus fluctus TaxID=1462730 RepID=UPI000AC90FFC|nr:SCP2 sterol-binding domain-containing protein [Sodalis-like endosymbiont of Proechinophthirus fluctus]
MPLISVTLEAVLKRLLYQDLAMSSAINSLKDKVFRFELAEWETPIILVFGERQVYVLNTWEDAADCTVITRLAILPALLERQRLTQLIKLGFLEVEGDPQCLQQFAELLYMAEFDAAELLAPLVGDIAAEGATQAVACRLTEAQRLFRTGYGRVTQAITDEWRLVPSALELAWFCGEVDDVTRACENLAARLDKLEARR